MTRILYIDSPLEKLKGETPISIPPECEGFSDREIVFRQLSRTDTPVEMALTSYWTDDSFIYKDSQFSVLCRFRLCESHSNFGG